MNSDYNWYRPVVYTYLKTIQSHMASYVPPWAETEVPTGDVTLTHEHITVIYNASMTLPYPVWWKVYTSMVRRLLLWTLDEKVPDSFPVGPISQTNFSKKIAPLIRTWLTTIAYKGIHWNSLVWDELINWLPIIGGVFLHIVI